MNEPTAASAPQRPGSIVECALIDGLLRLAVTRGSQSPETRLLATGIRRLYGRYETEGGGPCPAA